MGEKRPENAGRRAGTPNKRPTLRVLDQLLERGINPLEEALKLARSDMIADDKRLDFWLKIMSYCYPQLKSVEVSGDAANPLRVTTENVVDLCRRATEAAAAVASVPDEPAQEPLWPDEPSGDAGS